MFAGILAKPRSGGTNYYMVFMNSADLNYVSLILLQKFNCNETRCLGSVYMPPSEDKRYASEMRSKEEIKKHALEFLNEFYASSKQ